MRDALLILRMLVNCVAPLALLFIMSTFKCRQKTGWLAFGGLVLFGAAANMGLYYACGQTVMMRYFAVIVAVPSLLLLLLLTKDRLSQLFFAFFTAINALYLTAILGRLASGMNEELIWPDVLARAVLYGVILFLFRRYLAAPYQFLAHHMHKGWGVIAVVPFLFFLLVMFMGLYPTVRTDNFAAVMILYGILCVVYLVIYRVFRSTRDLLLRQQEEQALAIQLEAQGRQLAQRAESDRQQQILRHDMRHFIQSVQSLLAAGDTLAALQFLGGIGDRLDQALPVVYCENPTMNILLADSIEQAQQRGIAVTASLDIPESLPVDPLELAMVFANAIENAVHACDQMPEGADKRIDMRSVSRPKFVFEIANTYAGKLQFGDDGLPVSAEMGHGLGMQSIAAFVRRHDAVIDCRAADGIFRLRILLQE